MVDLFYLLIVRGIKVSDGEDLNIYCGVLIVKMMDRLQIYLTVLQFFKRYKV